MNNFMKEKWNSTVTDNDRLLHLGDFAFGKVEQTRDLLRELRGYKVLVKGNHCRSRDRMCELGFSETYNELLLETPLGKVICTHKPLEKPTMINFHGHTHNSTPKFKAQDNHRWINFSVENWNYTPVLLEEVCNQFLEWDIGRVKTDEHNRTETKTN